MVHSRVAAPRPTPPLLNHGRDRRLPVPLRREPGRSSDVLPAEKRIRFAPEARRAAPTTASKQTVSASKSYAPHHEYIFSPRVFTELQNAQAIALPYDGLNPMPPQFCYLKPHYLDVQTSYFDHLAKGAL